MRLAALAVLTICLAAEDRIGLNGRIEAIPLVSTAGKSVTLATGGKVTAVFFISARCPISNDYLSRMKDLYRAYSPKGVQFVFVNSNFNESAPEVEKHAKESEFPFPVWKDQASAADLFRAETTPEAYVIDRTGVIRYHGAIDDARNPARVTRQHVRVAIDELLAGKAVAVSESKAFGCTIKRAKASS